VAMTDPSNGALGGGTGAGGILTTTTTAPIPAPHAHTITYPSWQYATAPAVTTPGFLGEFHVRQVENGYIVEYSLQESEETSREYYAADLKEAGERITALCVEKTLKPKGVK
jgi:hypothetical protein